MSGNPPTLLRGFVSLMSVMCSTLLQHRVICWYQARILCAQRCCGTTWMLVGMVFSHILGKLWSANVPFSEFDH